MKGGDKQVPPRAKILLFGDYGTAKTSLMGTCLDDPRMFPRLLVDFESGSMSIQSKIREVTFQDLDEWSGWDENKQTYSNPVNYPIAEGKIDVIVPNGYDDLTTIVDILAGNRLPYKMLCIDSISEINHMSLSKVTAENHKKNKKGNGIMPLIGDYGDNAASMRKTVREFRDLKMHVVISALSQEKANEGTGAQEIKPAVSGQLSTDIPGMMNGCGYIYVHKENPDARVITFKQTNRIKAKDRTENSILSSKDFLWEKGQPILTEIFDRLQL